MIRLLIAAGVALAIAIVGTKALIEVLRRRGIGQPIREDGPQGHVTKAGTPPMGGVAIVGAAAVAYLISDFAIDLLGDSGSAVFTRTGLFVMLLICGAGLVGLADDWIKVSSERNLGLNKRMKSLGLLAVAVLFTYLMLEFTNVHTTLSFTTWDTPGWELGTLGWAVLSVVMISAVSNAVNITDGLDGLAAGSATMAYSAFVVIGFWAFRHPDVYDTPHALDLAVIAAAMLGACTGFLWWNANPAKIFMGDTGSLAIGAGLAGLALATNTQLLLIIIGGLYVLETTSVMLQVASFRLFGQRRIFRMAPIHHHFELGGWPETTVIVRFWIIAGLCVALGIGLFYADFVGSGAVEL